MLEKNNLPVVTICIPIFNGEKYISRAVVSALQQTYPELEILIVDDGSTDSSLKLVSSFQSNYSNKIKVVKHARTGMVNNWNICIKESKGEYIKFLHQDDQLTPNCVEKLMEVAMEDEAIGLVFSKRGLIMESQHCLTDAALLEAQNIHKNWSNLKRINEGVSLLTDPLLLLNPISQRIGEPTTVLIKKSVFDRVGYFDSLLQQAVDIEMWLRIASCYKIGYVDLCLSYWRIHSGQATHANVQNLSLMLNEQLRIYDSIVFNPDYPHELRLVAKSKLRDIIRIYKENSYLYYFQTKGTICH